MRDKKLTFIDLFAGCGGLSEGFMVSNKFEPLAHVEWEMPMVETLRNRLVKKWKHTVEEAQKRVVCFDIQKTEELINGQWNEETQKKYRHLNSEFTANYGLKGLCEGRDVDLIIGGPPCQAYSIAGRAQDPNSMKSDYRNFLFESFCKVVNFFKPKVFVFENVPGLLSACPGDKLVTERIFEAFDSIGYSIRTPNELKKSVFCAEDYETPQKRNRIIIIGVRKGSEEVREAIYEALAARKKNKQITVRDAIGNLPKFRPIEEPLKGVRGKISHELVGGVNEYTLHFPRYNNKRDIQTFKDWISNNMNEWPQKEKLEYYTRVSGRKSNHIKYRNIEWDKPSPTVVAHLHKDGLMFIHPDVEQLRTITIREAAILQSFPNDFDFLGSTPYCFKMIGNAVPVQFAKNIALAINRVLKEKE